MGGYRRVCCELPRRERQVDLLDERQRVRQLTCSNVQDKGVTSSKQLDLRFRIVNQFSKSTASSLLSREQEQDQEQAQRPPAVRVAWQMLLCQEASNSISRGFSYRCEGGFVVMLLMFRRAQEEL